MNMFSVPNTTYCKEWGTTDEARPMPSQTFLTGYMVSLACGALVCGVAVKSLRPKALRKLLQDVGIAVHKVAKTASEIERKIFHLCGLLVPLIYQLLLIHGYSRSFCLTIVWSITILGLGADFARIHVPIVRENWPLRSILREGEQNKLCGGSYFSLGCTLALHLFAPVIAMTSIIFLVMGDLCAALVGRSFGQSICSVKIGPGGKKSVEGSAAMFLTCLVFGCTIFSQVHLREYAVVIGSLMATLTELYEPFGINDNVTIPILSGISLTFGFARTYSCEPARNPLLWYS